MHSEQRAARRRSRIATVLGLLSAVAAAACSSSNSSVAPCEGVACADGGANDPNGRGGTTGGGGVVSGDSPDGIGDAGALPNGIFVSPSGSDSADGSPKSPKKSIAAAITAAYAGKLPVILCSTTFTENIELTSGVTIRGGFDCANGWRPTNDRAVIAPPKGTPLTIRNAADPIVMERVSVKAADTTDPGASSIAAFVVNAANVTFAHMDFTAGHAGDGAAPPPAVPSAPPAPSGENGVALSHMRCLDTLSFCGWVALGGNGSPPGTCGAGGAGGASGNIRTGAKNQSGSAGLPAGFGGAGGPNRYIYPEDGRPGRDGDVGASGAAAASGIGTVTVDGYVPSNHGGDGQPGTAGGGGGGGSGGYSDVFRDGDLTYQDFYIGGGGGQGGFGGCGGAGGKGAGAGGASVALLVVDSLLSISQSTLNASVGGRGADGAAGAVGQDGGRGGRGGTSTVLAGLPHAPALTDGAGGNGGPGGRGGKGGAGGPGGGGPSIALLASGATPKTEALTFNVGAGGKGGHAIVGADAADGITGELVTLGVADAGAN